MPTFRTVLWSGDGRNAGIVVPDDVLASLNAGKRVPVVVTVGEYTYRSTTAVMGGKNLISFNADTRARTGKGIGDEIEVTLEVDTAPRTVEVPDALQKALDANPAAAAAWEKTAPSQKKAHAASVAEAKTEETRDRRVAKIVEKLVG
ncbi:hypothetical protein M2152_001688 [Microbacteriaceae bacterium SG_E_30_P1]|uniref:DUF1905 domain-containing protein n=1 Tax=Antiquaquibacter oligotrophicus TaxID=2880260 RepID=A0ABT6KNB6_9MICO|nr:YdeI/OmpD-associated family protein [Antiquaquibacter oligotrophicus]MDH6181506.1 hypothetical protein [Antiquaquibacter oligotrophicus]UDF12804.1 YdeI/OmpD-associated family protein [Antiquaquibacter oligotrophicus]